MTILQNVLFEQNGFISQDYRFFFTETTVMGSANILWKFQLGQIIFLHFLDVTGIGRLKYKEIRVSGAKLFWLVYWPAKDMLQHIDAICFIAKMKNSNCPT